MELQMKILDCRTCTDGSAKRRSLDEAHGAILWFFKESHLRKLWPSYDCYFKFGKSSEVQSKSQMRKLL